jgi:hypothetical protein
VQPNLNKIRKTSDLAENWTSGVQAWWCPLNHGGCWFFRVSLSHPTTKTCFLFCFLGWSTDHFLVLRHIWLHCPGYVGYTVLPKELLYSFMVLSLFGYIVLVTSRYFGFIDSSYSYVRWLFGWQDLVSVWTVPSWSGFQVTAHTWPPPFPESSGWGWMRIKRKDTIVTILICN